MGGQSAFDVAEMAQAAQRVEAGAQEIQGIKGALSSEHEQLQGQWQGAASDAFRKVYDEFDGQLNRILASLSDLGEKLTGARTSYEASVEEQQANINSIAGSINL